MGKRILMLLSLVACLAQPAGAAELPVLCALGETAAARWALEDGAAPNARYDLGMTPLHYTVWAGVTKPLRSHLEIIRLLAEWGADVNAQDDWGRTPLCLALDKGALFTDVSELLLSLGADPNQASDGLRPLCLAAERGSPRQVEALLEYGADVSLRDTTGRPPLTAALSLERPALEHMEKARLLLDAGADVNARCALWGDDEVTPLMAAATTASTEVLEFLMDRGALGDLRSRSGVRAYDYAVLAGREDNARLLR